MNPTVSIIVPVYNAEKYIERCVESILSQEYRDFEVILVDDGSKDGSGVLCDHYAREDSRVRVIHKENTGVSDTRNKAIAMAKGEFLQFVDSDDWLAPDATGLLVRGARELSCDLVIADFYRVSGERLAQKGDIEETSVMTREEFAGHMMENPADFYYGVLWNKLYRRDIVEKYRIRMDEKISWCEDFMFNMEYILHARRFLAIQIPIYYYVKRKGSLVSQGTSISKTIKMKLGVFEYYNNFYKHVLDEEDYDKNRLQVYRFLVDAAGDGAVPPAIFPGSKKLGEERMNVCVDALDGEGPLMEDYRRRKLLEYCMETVSKKYALTYQEIRVLLHLEHMPAGAGRRELADFVGVSRSGMTLLLKKLEAKDFIKTEEIKPLRALEPDPDTMTQARGGKTLKISVLPAAEPVLNEIRAALKRYEDSLYRGFTAEELRQYEALQERIKDNVLEILQ